MSSQEFQEPGMSSQEFQSPGMSSQEFQPPGMSSQELDGQRRVKFAEVVEFQEPGMSPQDVSPEDMSKSADVQMKGMTSEPPGKPPKRRRGAKRERPGQLQRNQSLQ